MSALSPTSQVTAVFGAVTVTDRGAIAKTASELSRAEGTLILRTRMLAALVVPDVTTQRYEPVLLALDVIAVHAPAG